MIIRRAPKISRMQWTAILIWVTIGITLFFTPIPDVVDKKYAEIKMLQVELIKEPYNSSQIPQELQFLNYKIYLVNKTYLFCTPLNGWCGVAFYDPPTDRIMLSASASINGLIHEMGHRYWYTKLTYKQVREYEKLYESEKTCFPTKYSHESVTENYAENFKTYFTTKTGCEAIQKWMP